MDARPLPLDWIPTIPRRYATTAIDGLLVIAALVIPTVMLGDNEPSRIARVVFALAMLLLYEPICTGQYVTLGQWITGVRVRDFKTGGKIGVVRAWGRIIVKALLGVISFLVLPFSRGRRAIHDFATGSIVILGAAEPEFTSWAQGSSDQGSVGSPAEQHPISL